MKQAGIFLLIAVLVLAGTYYLARTPRDAQAVTEAELQGKPVPDFSGTDLGGNPVRFSSLQGKAVVVNFWATWCAPCREETPWFVDIQKQYGPQGVQVIGVALDDSGKDVLQAFAQRYQLNYPVVIGDETLATAFGGVRDLPTTFYIGRDGKIVSRVLGLVSREEMERNVQAALKQGTQTESAL